MIAFTLSDWYWIVAGSNTQVYSSKRVQYVPITDATYVAWLASGGRPTKIAVEQDLIDMLILAGIPMPAGAISSDGAKNQMVNQLAIVVGQILFNHENRIRALEAKAPITKQQFITAVKVLLP